MPAITSLDLSNAKLDVDTIAAIATSSALTVTDRLGNIKRTMSGVDVDANLQIEKLGYEVPVTYSSGVSMVRSTQTVYYSGVTYAPKPDVLPFTTSGTFETAKFRVTQGVTTAELSSPTGSQLVGYRSVSLENKLDEFLSIRDCGAIGNGSSDDLAALLSAKAKGNFIRFPRVNVADTTYYFSALSVGLLDGLTFIADDGVTLSFATGQYNLYNSIKFASDVKVKFRDVNINYIFTKTMPVFRKNSVSIPSSASRRRRISLNCTDTTQVNLRRVSWPTADTFTTATGTTAPNYAILDAASGVFQGAFVELGAYETVSGFFENGFAGNIGVIIRGNLGYAIIYASNSTSNLVAATKLTGQTITGNTPNLPWPSLGQGRYNSFSPDKSVWSVTKTEAGRAVVKFNGRALTQPYAPYVGDIFEVGFVCFGTQFMVSGMTLERRTDAVLGMPQIGSLSIWGDSTAESLPSSWDKYMKPLLDGLYGVKLGNVVNNAVSGQGSTQQLALMNTYGFGDANYVIFCIGTNDIQGSTGVINLINNVGAAIDLIQGSGKKAVIVTPWMWYTRTQSGGNGQESSAYDAGSKYRITMERVTFDKGAILVNLNAELPNPDPALLTTEPLAALLRDNIHQDALANQLYATAIAKAIMDDYLSMPDSVEETVAGALMLGGATADADLKITYSKDGLCGLSGGIALNGATAGGNLMRIPRHISPTHNITVMCIAQSASADLGIARVIVRSDSASLQLASMPSGTTRILLTGCTWKIAVAA